jgi:hypothetical protein
MRALFKILQSRILLGGSIESPSLRADTCDHNRYVQSTDSVSQRVRCAKGGKERPLPHSSVVGR